MTDDAGHDALLRERARAERAERERDELRAELERVSSHVSAISADGTEVIPADERLAVQNLARNHYWSTREHLWLVHVDGRVVSSTHRFAGVRRKR
jgi:hypothetical protein